MIFNNVKQTVGELFASAKTYFVNSGNAMMNNGSNLTEIISDMIQKLSEFGEKVERHYSMNASTIQSIQENAVEITPTMAKKMFDIFHAYPTVTNDNRKVFNIYSGTDFDDTRNIGDVTVILSQAAFDSPAYAFTMNEAVLFSIIDENNVTRYYAAPVLRCVDANGQIYSFPVAYDVDYQHTSTTVIESVARAIGKHTSGYPYNDMVAISDYFNLGYTELEVRSMSYSYFTNLILDRFSSGSDFNAKADNLVRSCFFSNIGVSLRTLANLLLRSATLNLNLSTIMNYCALGDLSGLKAFLNSAKLVSETGTLEESSWYDQLLDAINSSGISGASAMLVQLLKSANSATDDGDSIKFTDNASIAPKIFYVGIIDSVINIVGTVASTIAAIFHPIAGVIGYALTSVVSKIYSWVTGKYDDDTLASLDSTRTLFCYPNTVYHGTCNVSEFQYEDPEFYDALMKYNVCKMQIPGGIIMFWTNGDDKTTAYFEVHVVPVTKTVTQAIINDLVQNNFLPSYTVTSNTHYYLSSAANRLSIFDDAVSAHYDDNQSQVQEYIIECTDQVTLDARLRESYFGGFMLTMLFIMMTPFFRYTQTIIPWESNGNSKYDDVSLSQGLDKLFYSIMDLSHNMDVFNPTWMEIFGTNDNHSNLFRCFDKFLSTINGIQYYDGQDSVSNYQDTFVARMAGLLAYFVTGDDYTSSLPEGVTLTLTCAIRTPKYDRDTYWASVIGAAIALAVVAAVTFIIVRQAKKAISNWNAKWRAKSEAAWQKYMDDPTTENYNAYYKSVRSNNILTGITGGTKLSKSSYWDDVSSSSRDTPTSNKLLSLADQSDDKIEDVITLLVGQH